MFKKINYKNMNNFEQINLGLKPDKNKDFFNKLNREVADFISTKTNPIINAIKDSSFNLNNPNVNKKIEKLSNSIVEKFFSNDNFADFDFQDNLERRILKTSLEELAESELGGSLGFYEDLENNYLDILSKEASFLISNDSNFNSSYDLSAYIKDLCDRLNKKNILDKNKKGQLFDRIKNSIEKEELKNVA